MSEPTDDSPSTPPAPPAEPPAGGTSSQNLARTPRANPPSIHNQKEAPPAGAPPGFSEFLTWMKMMGEGGATEEEAARAGRGVLPKEQKKFSRRSAEIVKTATGTAPSPVTPTESEMMQEAVSQGEQPSTAIPVSVPADSLHLERKRRSKETQGTAPSLRLLLQAFVFALIVGSFFLGRVTVPKPVQQAVAAPGAPVESKEGGASGILPSQLADKVDEALAAESHGNPRRGQELLQSVKDAGGRVVGLNYHLALLAYSSGDLPKVLPLLNLSIAEGEEIAACYNLRGTMANRQGGVEKGLSDLELATKLDPFNARYAFFYGEALRRNGKPQAALTALRQALNRLRDPALESVYSLKVRLAQIELGQEAEFADEMAAQLARNPPSPDWILTAAAVELHRGNFAAAAGFLDKAKSVVQEPELLSRLRDFYFYSFSNEKELERFFAPIKKATQPVAAPPVNPAAPAAPARTPGAPLLDAPSPFTLLKSP